MFISFFIKLLEIKKQDLLFSSVCFISNVAFKDIK